MSLQEKSDLVLTFAQLLHENGQSTDDTLAAAERLSNSLGPRTTIVPGWEEIQLASKIAHYAMDNDLTRKAAALKLGFVTAKEFDRVVDPARMVHP